MATPPDLYPRVNPSDKTRHWLNFAQKEKNILEMYAEL